MFDRRGALAWPPRLNGPVEIRTWPWAVAALVLLLAGVPLWMAVHT